MSLNKVMLIGNVGKDPEIRYLEQGPAGAPGSNAKVGTFPLATTERYRDRNGEQRENTEWHNIVVWRGLADVVEKYVKKGTQIYVEGRLRTRSWSDQSGNKKYTTEIIADALQLLGRKTDNPAAQPGNYGAPYQGGNASAQSTRYETTPQGGQYGNAPQGAQATRVQDSQPVDFSDISPEDDLPF